MRTLKANILNFNLTFGIDNEPMLKHFEDIVYPAFKKGYKKYFNYDKSYYEFMEVELKEFDNRIALTGTLMKKAEIKDITEPGEGDVVKQKNNSLTLYPVSYFIIFLDNHRMIYLKNQPESPNYIAFNSAVRFVLKKYVKDMNKSYVEAKKDKKMPYPIIDITHIPNKDTIRKKLRNVKKINSLTLKLFIPNAEPNRNEAVDSLIDEIVGMNASRARTEIFNIQNIEAASEFLISTGTQSNYVLDVTENDDSRHKMDSEIMSETQNIRLGDLDDTNRVIDTLYSETKEIDLLKKVDNNMRLLYNNLKDIIEKLF